MKLNIFKSNKPKLIITGINLKLQGHTHTLKGMEVGENLFEIDIPFKNKTHTDMLTAAASFKAQEAKPFPINGIEVSDPFKIVSVTPKPPLVVKADEKIDFKISLQGPTLNYTGPLTINFVSDTVELIHVEFSKTVIEAKGKKISIAVSSRILNLQKGQIFSEKIQLYKGFSYGDTISKIEVEKPFKYVSSDPKLPLKIDDTNSYILNIYIQGPDAPYAGILDIKIS